MPKQSLFATCPKHLESLLLSELQELGAKNTRETVGGVFFEDAKDLDLAYRVCLWSRLANKVLLILDQAKVEGTDELYSFVNGIEWQNHFRKDCTFRVDFSGSNHFIRHSNFGALLVKDAIVDKLRAQFGERPSIEKHTPDLIINVRLAKGQVHLAIDFSGESLHKRGYRVEQGSAPLKENLAAALLIRAGWPKLAKRGDALIDPMCGSGTFLIEGAMIAADVAPGLHRDCFGFQGWAGFDPEQFRILKEEAVEREQQGLQNEMPEIRGYDHDSHLVFKAEQNIHAAGLEKWVRVSTKDIKDLVLPTHKKIQPGLIICNPPYGERLGELNALKSTYQHLAASVKKEFCDWQLAVFTGNSLLAKELRLRAKNKYKFFNGPIASELLLFDIVGEAQAKLKAPDVIESADLSEDNIEHEQQDDESRGLTMLLNRLKKNQRRLKNWLKVEDIHCYRLYDADLPEYSAAIDVYEGRFHVQEYAAPASVDPEKAETRFQTILDASALLAGVEKEALYSKQRKRNKGKQQYEKLYEGAPRDENFFEVREGGAKFYVNLQDYLDTGLFLDHRPLRARIGSEAKGKTFLNLFCYTATATVHAALGGAVSSVSVDMSNTYLDWAERNYELNNVHKNRHKLERQDCFSWLQNCRQGFDLILLDPPSFSNSKKMERVLDIQRDHVKLIDRCMDILKPGGVLYFSNNFRKFSLDETLGERFDIMDLSAETLDKDFLSNPKIHHCWKICAK